MRGILYLDTRNDLPTPSDKVLYLVGRAGRTVRNSNVPKPGYIERGRAFSPVNLSEGNGPTTPQQELTAHRSRTT